MLVLAGIRSPQICVEGVHGFFAAYVAEHAVGFQYFASTSRDAFQFKLRVIAVGDGTSFDGHKVCSAVAQIFTGPASAKSTLSICGWVIGTILFSLTARSI